MANSNKVYIVDDDVQFRESMEYRLRGEGFEVHALGSAFEFLDIWQPGEVASLILDVRLKGMGGMKLIETLAEILSSLSVIIVTGYGDVALAVRALRLGADDFFLKPVLTDRIIRRIREGLESARIRTSRFVEQRRAKALLGQLTAREFDVLDLILEGRSNKEIAFSLRVTPRTVECHRASIMVKSGVASLAELVRLSQSRLDDLLPVANRGSSFCPPSRCERNSDLPVVTLVEDDDAYAESLVYLLDSIGYTVRTYPSAEALLETGVPDASGCLMLDFHLPGISGLDLLAQLKDLPLLPPVIFVSAFLDIPATVGAFLSGAMDVLEKPVNPQILIERVEDCVTANRVRRERHQILKGCQSLQAELTPRELVVMERIVAGITNAGIASELGISPRTVESHRHQVFRKMGADSVPHLVRISLILEDPEDHDFCRDQRFKPQRDRVS